VDTVPTLSVYQTLRNFSRSLAA